MIFGRLTPVVRSQHIKAHFPRNARTNRELLLERRFIAVAFPYAKPAATLAEML
jgi:hypothetical protein